MFARHAPLVACAALAASLVSAPRAEAATNLGVLRLALAASAQVPQEDCRGGISPAFGSVALAPIASAPSKAASLLGGQVSQLELMRQQQAGLAPAAPALAPAAGPAFGAAALKPCSVGLAAVVRPDRAISQFSAGPLRGTATSPEDFLASKRLPIRRTSFDREWNRVRGSSLAGRSTAALVSIGRGTPRAALLGAVNSWMNAKIRYVEDRELYGQADYWASARETLGRRAGDCEDIAIAKMQALAALGIDKDAMYLTIVRDTVRAADHAVLVVQVEGKAWVLDNNTDRLLDASESYDYRPILSFSEGRKWIHGY